MEIPPICVEVAPEADGRNSPSLQPDARRSRQHLECVEQAPFNGVGDVNAGFVRQIFQTSSSAFCERRNALMDDGAVLVQEKPLCVPVARRGTAPRNAFAAVQLFQPPADLLVNGPAMRLQPFILGAQHLQSPADHLICIAVGAGADSGVRGRGRWTWVGFLFRDGLLPLDRICGPQTHAAFVGAKRRTDLDRIGIAMEIQPSVSKSNPRKMSGFSLRCQTYPRFGGVPGDARILS